MLCFYEIIKFQFIELKMEYRINARKPRRSLLSAWVSDDYEEYCVADTVPNVGQRGAC